MKFLRDSFLWIILLASLGLWLYVDTNKPKPCLEPRIYTIGTFDSRFKMTRAQFEVVLSEAEAMWESASGKNLFTYEKTPKPHSEFYKLIGKYFVPSYVPINLIYDERQQNSEARLELESEVADQKADAESIKREFTALQQRYASESSKYQTMLKDYRQRKVSYESLEAQRLEVNRLAGQINSRVKQYNSLVGELNSTVSEINQQANREFEEGQYVYDKEGERINIYEFRTRTDLVRVVAHELGHALGLDHNENEDSIMYYLNSSENLKPTAEDIAALNAICKAQ